MNKSLEDLIGSLSCITDCPVGRFQCVNCDCENDERTGPWIGPILKEEKGERGIIYIFNQIYWMWSRKWDDG